MMRVRPPMARTSSPRLTILRTCPKISENVLRRKLRPLYCTVHIVLQEHQPYSPEFETMWAGIGEYRQRGLFVKFGFRIRRVALDVIEKILPILGMAIV